MTKEWYKVVASDNYYDDFVGTKEFETDRTILLEFKMNKLLGGTQKAMFFKEQLIFDGEY